jgi:hypothetical protein
MKKVFVLFTSLFFYCNFLNAQAALIVLLLGDKVATEKFHLSVDAGLNFASMPGLTSQKMTPGLYFGLGTFIKLNDKWALTPEFKPLSSRGAKSVAPIRNYSPTLSNPSYDIALNYIDLPVLVQYKINDKIFVSAGPQISFLTAAKQLATGTTAAGTVVDVEEKMKSNFKSTYFSFPLELGYHLADMRKGKGVDIKLRYGIGLSEMIAIPSYGSSNGSTFQLFFSFPFIK